MKSDKILDIIDAQKNCLIMKCDRKCKFCEYGRNTEEVLAAFNAVIDMINGEKGLKKEFFNSGIEYSKAELTRLIEKEKDEVAKQHKDKEIDDLNYAQVLGLQRALEIAENIRKR